jgi:2-oxoglutarate ferredoxin oxidoreductase subunit gamma
MAIELGNIQVANMIMLGAYLESSQLFGNQTIHKVLQYILGEKKAHLVEINVQAIEAGRRFIQERKSFHA